MPYRITININESQDRYFRNHPELNRSEFIRQAIDEHIDTTIRDRLVV